MDIVIPFRILEFSGVLGYWVQDSFIIGLGADCAYGILRGIRFDGDRTFRVEVLQYGFRCHCHFEGVECLLLLVSPFPLFFFPRQGG